MPMTPPRRQPAVARALRRALSLAVPLLIAGQLAACAITGGDVLAARATPREVAPIAFFDAANTQRTLADFRGKTVLLSVWAPWCQACISQLPALQRLEQELGGDDFAVIALAVDRKGPLMLPSWQDRFKVKEMDLYVDPTLRSIRALGTRSVPTTILLNPQGRELARVTGKRFWDSPEVMAEMRRHIRAGAPMLARAGAVPEG